MGAKPWDITTKVEEFMADIDPNHGLLRICLFENLIGMSSRPAESDGNLWRDGSCIIAAPTR